MRTKLIAAGTAAAALAALLTGCGSSDDDKLTIGIKFDQPGLGLRSGSEYKGFDVDVARYVAKELGYDEDQIEFKETPSPQRENMLQSGQVDMIFATYSITDARKEKVAFAGPYFIAGQDLLVAADNTDITGPDTLDGKKLCSVQGSTSAQKVKDDYSTGVQLQEFDTYSKCIEQLVAGTIDAVTTDDIILAGFAAQEANAGKLKVVGKPVLRGAVRRRPAEGQRHVPEGQRRDLEDDQRRFLAEGRGREHGGGLHPQRREPADPGRLQLISPGWARGRAHPPSDRQGDR